MKLWYKTVVSQSSYGGGRDNEDHREVKRECCCKRMEQEWGESIDFDGGYFGSARIGIKQRRYEDDVEYSPIDFCPWCKAPVKTIRSQRVRQVPRKVVETKQVEHIEYDYIEEPVPSRKDEETMSGAVIECPSCGAKYRKRDLDVCCNGTVTCVKCGKEWEE